MTSHPPSGRSGSGQVPGASPGPCPPAEPSAADTEALQGAKQVLRKAIRLRRESRPAADRRADDEARFAQLHPLLARELAAGRERPTVALYLSRGSEPATLQLVSWLAAQDVPVLLPVLGRTDDDTRRTEPDWAPYGGPDRLRGAAHGIGEPTTAPLGAEGLAQADVIVCPGLAGTSSGQRLGAGAGWYDRALPEATPETPVILLLNDDEVLDELPVEPWDLRVDLIVTPTRLLETPSTR
ncbi:MAG: 5-formyltetrahydrofolate cyclo-ligase [Propionibacteriaceae bacterium]